MIEEFKQLLMQLGLSLADLVIFLVRLRDAPVWQGVLHDVVLSASETTVTIPHGLGRAHRGAMVVLASEPVPLFAVPAEDEVNLTLVVDTASLVNVIYRVWVF